MSPDPAADGVLKPYRDQLALKFDGKIGAATAEFTRDASQAERKQESPLGDLLTDAFLAKYQSVGAQIAVVNGGGIRAPLPSSYAPVDKSLHRTVAGYVNTPPWDLVVGDIYTVLPFGNTCVVRKVTGQVLWQVLEKSVASEPAAFGGFLQIAGFKFTYKLSGAPEHLIECS